MKFQIFIYFIEIMKINILNISKMHKNITDSTYA